MEWYYAEAGERVGPIPDADFRALCAAGQLRPENLVWRAGMAGWERAGSLEEWPLAPAAANQVACTECGRLFAPSNLLTFESAHICSGCKDLVFQRFREQGAPAVVKGSHRYGGFWIRALARLIDSAILWVAFMALILLWEASMRRVLFNPAAASSYEMIAFWSGFALIYLLAISASLAYEAWFLARRSATPGKLALGLRVFRSDGERLTLGRSVGRSFGYLLSSLLPLCIGFLMAAIDEEKRALHDRLCDTRVVYRS